PKIGRGLPGRPRCVQGETSVAVAVAPHLDLAGLRPTPAVPLVAAVDLEEPRPTERVGVVIDRRAHGRSPADHDPAAHDESGVPGAGDRRSAADRAVQVYGLSVVAELKLLAVGYGNGPGDLGRVGAQNPLLEVHVPEVVEAG